MRTRRPASAARLTLPAEHSSRIERPATASGARPGLPRLLMGACLLWTALAVLDPDRPSGGILGPLLAVAVVGGQALRRRPWRGLILPLVLAAAFGVSSRVKAEFRGDSAAYFAYLRSIVFDLDLDFTNEWVHWGYREAPLTETGLRTNAQSVGPALLWSPFYLAAHAYVTLGRALGFTGYPADGYSLPYRRSTALGTLVSVILGAWLLTRMMAPTNGWHAATLAVVGTTLASPVLYYAFVVPTMAHGAAFGAAAALVWAWDRARRVPSMGTWTTLGALLGLAALIRWQAAGYVLLVLPLAILGLLRKAVRPGWLLAAAGAAALVFTPQILAWRILFGRLLTIPQGGTFLDWSSPHLLDTLFSADHGLFSGTPAMVLGFAGLLLGLRNSPLLHGGALLVFVATAWINGGVRDWAGSDAFGARRYDVVIPLLAVGLGTLLAALAPRLARAPLLAPAGLLLFLGLWNAGFIALFREGRYPDMAPWERLARDQARHLRLAAQDIAGRLAGPRGRALAYKYFSAEYLYTSFNPGATINLASAQESDLRGSWGTPGRRPEEPPFRWALHPEACVRLPLEEPFDLTATVTARAPRKAEDQVVTFVLNGSALAAVPLNPEWQEIHVTCPARNLLPGENLLCLRFRTAAPGEEGGQVAAAVSRIQLR